MRDPRTLNTLDGLIIENHPLHEAASLRGTEPS